MTVSLWKGFGFISKLNHNELKNFLYYYALMVTFLKPWLESSENIYPAPTVITVQNVGFKVHARSYTDEYSIWKSNTWAHKCYVVLMNAQVFLESIYKHYAICLQFVCFYGKKMFNLVSKH